MPKAFLISDIHLGIHPLKLDDHLNISKEYFDIFFFPLLKQYYKDGDYLFIIGDIFDNRTAIDIKVLCYGLNIFQWLEDNNINTHVLVGNHDMYNEKSYEFNSLRILEKFKNVTLYSKPDVLNIGNKKILMMPYITSLEEEKQILNQYKGKVDYLFCHSDLAGAKNNINSGVLTHGLSIADFVQFPLVYSGHIHLRQKIKNFTFIGSPYHLDRNDKGDQKGIYVVDIETGKERFIPNNISPQYQTVEILSESDIEKIDRIMKVNDVLTDRNDWYDVVISNSLIIDKPELRKKLMLFTQKKKLAQIKQIDDITIKDTVESIDVDDIGITLSITDLVREYVRNQDFKEGTIKDKIMDLLEEIIDTCEDKKDE